ncbi:MAG TPA: tetratricopeptide repeat protein [Polyangiales bacterium]|nr:tetratricopeptide repeat protein [Polyangiales bacterium]
MRLLLSFIMCVVLCVGAVAQAEGTADQKAAAEALFDKGLTLLKQGEYAQACAFLEQSQSVERGIGTMLYLAECYEKLGRTASAWAMFREAASAAKAEGQTDRAQAGAARAAQLEPQLAKLSILVPPAAQVPGLEVFRNGQPLPSAVWGVAVPVDPGSQRVEARAPGFETWSHTENLAKGAQLSMTVPPLTAAPTAAAEAPPAAATAAAATSEPQPASAAAPGDAASSTKGSVQRTAAWITGGVGAVGLIVGTYFGIRAASKNSDAEAACPDNMCSPPNYELHEDAQNAATLSNVFVISGAALVAAGVVLYLTAPKPEQSQAALHLGPTGAELALKF